MERKIGSITNLAYKLREFRGLPVSVMGKKHSVGNWVFGCLFFIDEIEPGKRLDLYSSDTKRRAFIRRYYERFNGMTLYNDIEVQLESVGQRIGVNGIYEGDILVNDKYPDCLFEVVWNKPMLSWIVKKIYGPCVDYSQEVRDYKISIDSWVGSFDWYPKMTPTKNADDPTLIYLGYFNDTDYWFRDSSYIVGFPTSTVDKKDMIKYTLDDVVIYQPEVFDALVARKFV